MTWPSSLDIARGLAPGCVGSFRYGRHTTVDSTYTPITQSGFYRTPQATAAVALRVKAGGNANDTASGSGAREITLVGLNPSGDVITETLATAGASASNATVQSFIRLTDAFVSKSGTYASQTAGSQAGSITIEKSTGSENWALIAAGTISRSVSEIGAYTTPNNKSACVTDIHVTSDADKKANIVMFKRQNILQTSAPYSALELVFELPQSFGLSDFHFDPPLYFPSLCDFGFMANVSASTVDISVGFGMMEFTAR
jgi:hypothetical protein